jgi:hypothetical protein
MDAWLKKANPGLPAAPKASTSSGSSKSNGAAVPAKRSSEPFKPVTVQKLKAEVDPTAVPWVEK